MTDVPAPSQPPIVHWTLAHTASVVAVTAFFVWMAIWLPWGLYTSWLVAMVTLAFFTLIIGHGVTGAWKGALVDERRKMSLSRLQLLLWTVLILSAFGTIAVARIQQDPVSAMSIAVPETVWALLGISTTSLIGSPLIKNAKKTAPAPSEETVQKLVEAQGKREMAADGQVMKNRSIDQASLADLFQGEYVGDFGQLDMAKIQMFFFTVLLVFAYAASVGALLRHNPYPNSLPDVGGGMLPLLGISHAGYLMSKAVTTPVKPS